MSQQISHSEQSVLKPRKREYTTLQPTSHVRKVITSDLSHGGREFESRDERLGSRFTNAVGPEAPTVATPEDFQIMQPQEFMTTRHSIKSEVQSHFVLGKYPICLAIT